MRHDTAPLTRVLAGEQQGGPADALAGERPAPHHELDHLALYRHPLSFDALGQQRVVECRGELDARRALRGAGEHGVERW